MNTLGSIPFTKVVYDWFSGLPSAILKLEASCNPMIKRANGFKKRTIIYGIVRPFSSL